MMVIDLPLPYGLGRVCSTILKLLACGSIDMVLGSLVWLMPLRLIFRHGMYYMQTIFLIYS